MPTQHRDTPKSPHAAAPSILIAGDLFRLSHVDRRFDWHQANNMAWVRNLALAMFGSVPDLAVTILDHAVLGLAPQAFGPAADQNPDQLWLERLAAPIGPELSARIAGAVAGKLVIGFELPANLRAAIEAHAALLVHLAVSPLRFADDLFLDISCTDAAIQAALAEQAVTDRELFWQAGLTRATLEPPAKITAQLPDDILLIADQIGNDRAMIVDGGFASLADYRDRLAELAAGHSLTLLKPHPHRCDIADFDRLAGLPRLRVTAANSYALMASGKIRTLAAVSSSLLSEARYFGVAAERLATPDYRRDAPADITVRAGALAGSVADLIAKRIGRSLPPLGLWRPERPTAIELRRFARDDWGLSKANRATPILTAADLDDIPPDEAMGASAAELTHAFVQGWHDREDWGLWGRSATATIALRWPSADPDRIRLSFELVVLSTKEEPSRLVELWVGDQRQAEGTASFAQRSTLACTIERPGDGLPIQIHFRTRAVEPAERGLPTTARTLSVGLFSMTWSASVAAHPDEERQEQA